MGIEATKTIKRSDAVAMLEYKNIRVYANDSLERLADLIYENRDTIFENYCVVEDAEIIMNWDDSVYDGYKTWW